MKDRRNTVELDEMFKRLIKAMFFYQDSTIEIVEMGSKVAV